MLIKKLEENLIVDVVGQEFAIFKYTNRLERVFAKNLDPINSADCALPLAFLYSDDNIAIYQSIGEANRLLFVWDYTSPQLKEINKFDTDLLVIGKSDKCLYLREGRKKFGKLDLESLDYQTLFQFAVTGKKHISVNKIISVGQGLKSIIQAHNLQGELQWEKKLLDYNLEEHDLPYQGRVEIKPNSYTFLECLLVNVFPYRLASININTGELNWVLPETVDKQWCIGNEGKVYSVFKGNLKIVDAETGDLLLDKPIDADWVQAEKDTLNLFQVNVSSTHLWCGFLGHGLCAINLETAKIDWHDFDGQTVNRKPIIKNNRIYVQLMADGIGLDNADVQEYILEGEGGYLEESDNEFVVF